MGFAQVPEMHQSPDVRSGWGLSGVLPILPSSSPGTQRWVLVATRCHGILGRVPCFRRRRPRRPEGCRGGVLPVALTDPRPLCLRLPAGPTALTPPASPCCPGAVGGGSLRNSQPPMGLVGDQKRAPCGRQAGVRSEPQALMTSVSSQEGPWGLGPKTAESNTTCLPVA